MTALARRWLKATALLITVGVLVAGARALTVAKVSLDEVLPKVQGQTSLPVHIPREIPGLNKVYPSVAISLDPERYTIYFNTENICYSWRCTYAAVIVDRKSRSTDKSYIPVQLANGIQGMYTPSSFGYDAAEVLWRQSDVQYQLFIKSRQPQVAVQLANSTILGEIKK